MKKLNKLWQFFREEVPFELFLFVLIIIAVVKRKRYANKNNDDYNDNF